MWEQLIRRQDREQLGIGFEQIESPFFAKKHVHQSLVGYGELKGLDALKTAFGCYGCTRYNLSEPQVRRMSSSTRSIHLITRISSSFFRLTRA